MDYSARAVQYVASTYGEGFGVVEQSIEDCERFYAFTYQTVKYLETGNIVDGAVGQGYIFIDKRDNRIHTYGSRLGYEGAREDLCNQLTIEARIRKDKPDFELRKRFYIRINALLKRQVVIEKLHGEVTYIIPEVVGGSIYRIPKSYTVKEIEQRLKDLPATFQALPVSDKLILELVTTACCDFDLLEWQERSAAKYEDKATEEDLKPIW